MADFPFAVIGFDLDGTLLDTSPDLGRAVNHALALAGCPALSLDAIRPMIGGGARVMLEKGLSQSGKLVEKDALDKLYYALLDYYEAHIARDSFAFPGLDRALDWLDALGVKMAVCTNKFEHLALKLLDEIGLLDRFVTVIGGDTMGKDNGKPNAAPIHEMIRRSGGGPAAFVGDSIYDVLAARNAAIPSIAVSFGFLDRPVTELGADAVIAHYDALVPTLQTLSG